MERPIILKVHEVRGILDGRQTQLRRIVKFPSRYAQVGYLGGGGSQNPDWNNPSMWGWWDDERGCWATLKAEKGMNQRQLQCPVGQVGMRLWVKEAARCTRYSAQHLQNHAEIDTEYKAGGVWGVRGSISFIDSLRQFPQCSHNADGKMRWASPLEMPRWASRILLEIVSVRVERLQDISEDDAIANCPDAIEDENGNIGDYRYSMFCLWDRMYGRRSTDENPWVWVISFKRVSADE